MKKRVFVPVESYALASPEMRLGGKHTDLGLLAEALVLFEGCDFNVTSGRNLADVLTSFLRSFDSISPFLDLVSSGALRIHYFDFMSAPVEKDGILMYWNIQDAVAAQSHKDSFEQKVLYHPAIDEVVPKARHRKKLYELLRKAAVIDASEHYGNAIEAARAASKSHEEMEFILNAFKDSLPPDLRRNFPEKITVKAEHDESKALTTHRFNIDFDQLSQHLPNLNFGKHIPGVGLVHTYRILYASRRHGYDVYLPFPLADAVLAKMDSLVDRGKRFSRTTVDLTRKACFPDMRSSFNEGDLNWKDILEIRGKASRFQDWFATYGGNPEVALATYGEEFSASTGLIKYREKFFSIATYVSTAAGAAIGASVEGPAGASVGAVVGGLVPFVKDLFKASDEEGWKPRFFGDWIHEKQRRGGE